MSLPTFEQRTSAKVGLAIAHTARRLFKAGACTVDDYHMTLDRALDAFDARWRPADAREAQAMALVP